MLVKCNTKIIKTKLLIGEKERIKEGYAGWTTYVV